MECVAVCAAGGFALADVAVMAVMVLAAALALAVLSVMLGYAWALALAVAVVIPPALWLLARVCKYGPTLEVFRRHQRQRRAPRTALPAARQTALPAGTSLRALPAPAPVVHAVITDARERTGHVVQQQQL